MQVHVCNGVVSMMLTICVRMWCTCIVRMLFTCIVHIHRKHLYITLDVDTYTAHICCSCVSLDMYCLHVVHMRYRHIVHQSVDIDVSICTSHVLFACNVSIHCSHTSHACTVRPMVDMQYKKHMYINNTTNMG